MNAVTLHGPEGFVSLICSSVTDCECVVKALDGRPRRPRVHMGFGEDLGNAPRDTQGVSGEASHDVGEVVCRFSSG
jgi:hypothetical protein